MALTHFYRRLLPRFAAMTPERRGAVYGEIVGMSTPSRSFYLMVAVSTTIAAYGLLSNSIAVVIGAMLVAPLMGPIFGIALGVLAGDRKMLRQASISESAGVALAVAVGFLIGSLPLRADFGAEIIARTQPTLYDIVVALASGVAGAYALVDERLSPALPGVAIATSLVPPLATCGLCLSAGQWEGASGAFILFLANLLAIEIASAIVFLAYGLAGAEAAVGLTLLEFVRRFGMSIVLLLAVTGFMTHTLVQVISERRLSDRVQAALSGQLRSILGAQLSEFNLRRQDGRFDVVAVVLTPQPIDSSLVERIQDRLRTRIDSKVNLIVRSLISSDADSRGPVYIANTELERRARVREETTLLGATSKTLTSQLSSIGGAWLVDVRNEQTDGMFSVTAVVRTPTVIDPPEVAEMQAALEQALKRPTHLLVRSVIAQDADSTQFLYNEESKTVPLTKEEAKFRSRLERAASNQLSLLVPGALLRELRYARSPKRLLVFAVARTPRVFTPEEVVCMQDAFREYVDPTTELIVRSEVGADAAEVGYLKSVNEELFAEPGR